MNQLATPGLGSFMAGKKISGLGQMLLAAGGFVLVLAWFVMTLIQTYHQITADVPPRAYGWLGAAGALIFLAAWLWALQTSLKLLREARQNPAGAAEVPPRITNTPGKI